MSAMSSAVRMAANMSMKVRVDVFSHALRFFFCENSPSLFVHRRLVLEKSQRASENGRSMCTQYSPNLLFNYSHASFAPVLSETPESLGVFYVVCCWLARFPTFFWLRRDVEHVSLWIKLEKERDSRFHSCRSHHATRFDFWYRSAHEDDSSRMIAQKLTSLYFLDRSLARPTTTRTFATTVSAGEAEASSEAATTTEAPKPKRRFPKKTITVKESDIEVGKEFVGKVKSTTTYGAFVDFGAKNDGLVHISELQAGFVENVGDVVSVNQEVKIWIKSMEKGRISLTMKPPPTEEEIAQQAANQQAKFEARQAFKLQKEKQSEVAGNLKKGAVLEGCEVKSIQNYGIFVEIAEGVEGLVHISELSDDFGVEAKDVANVGDKVTVRVLGVDGSKVKLSMKEKLDVSVCLTVFVAVWFFFMDVFSIRFADHTILSIF